MKKDDYIAKYGVEAYEELRAKARAAYASKKFELALKRAEKRDAFKQKQAEANHKRIVELAKQKRIDSMKKPCED